jgi:aminoglycoside 3-N-acetyltransferase
LTSALARQVQAVILGNICKLLRESWSHSNSIGVLFKDRFLLTAKPARSASAPQIKKFIKNGLNRLEWWYKRYRSFSPTDLKDALIALGIKTGDVVLAHIAFNEFLGFAGLPSDVVASLRSALSDSGTLLMPSMPFTGTAVDYVRSGEIFDVRRTPSHMGVVTELFRRSPGTLRSLHPTHPILANGPRAAELICDHHKALTPCGQFSPFAKLAEMDAKIALIGTGIRALTYYHYLEEVLEDQLPRSPFTEETFDIRFRGYDGEMMQVRNRLFGRELSRRRRPDILEVELKADGLWRERNVGRVSIVVLDARAVFDTVRAMAQRGSYCYARP